MSKINFEEDQENIIQKTDNIQSLADQVETLQDLEQSIKDAEENIKNLNEPYCDAPIIFIFGLPSLVPAISCITYTVDGVSLIFL